MKNVLIIPFQSREAALYEQQASRFNLHIICIAFVFVWVCGCVCVSECVRACVCACVRAFVRACVRAVYTNTIQCGVIII